MPTTLLTLPRELRDEIYIYPALSFDFAFLLTCRQVNEEGTPLLYRHGIYRVRALDFRVQRLSVPPKPPPFWLVQNLYIAMPSSGGHGLYNISPRTAPLLAQFAGTEVHRRTCHVNLRRWLISKDMARVLCSFGGFEIVRVETSRTGGRWGAKLIERRLERELGQAEWKLEQKWPATEAIPALDISIAEFRPRKFKLMNGSEGIGRVQSKEQGAQASASTSQSRDILPEDEEPVPEQSVARHQLME